MPYVFVRNCSDLSQEQAFNEKMRPQLTYIDFQSVSDNCLADQIKDKLPRTTVKYLVEGRGRYAPSNIHCCCPHPSYEVLNVLELLGYKVVGTHSANNASMWTLHKQT